jgi:hypothetical protein
MMLLSSGEEGTDAYDPLYEHILVVFNASPEPKVCIQKGSRHTCAFVCVGVFTHIHACVEHIHVVFQNIIGPTQGVLNKKIRARVRVCAYVCKYV